jgi:hypothetical protein
MSIATAELMTESRRLEKDGRRERLVEFNSTFLRRPVELRDSVLEYRYR